jgi:hypothetical protein
MIRSISLALSLCAMSSPTWAADTSWTDVTPRLEGCWEGEGLGGQVSECWLIADDGRADGMFLMRKNDKPNFAEILTIDDFGDGPEMRLKHVFGDMTGWEEKDDYVSFKLVSADADTLTFKGLVLIFDGDDKLRTELKMTMKNGETRLMPFSFRRTAQIARAEAPD